MKFHRHKYFGESLEETKDGPKGTHQGSRRVPGAASPRARRAPSWPPGPTPGVPLWPVLPPRVKTLNIKEFRSFIAASWRKPIEKKKPSPAGRFRRGDHLPEGEIIAIVIIVVTGIIEIIINIIPNINTICTTIPSHLTIATCVVIRKINLSTLL